MSLKSVEMQVALPRSQDAGKMQEQLNRQGQQFQQTLTEKQLKEEQLKRQQVNKSDQVEKKNLTDEEEANRQDEQERKRNSKSKSTQQVPKMKHPYIGNRIDFTR